VGGGAPLQPAMQSPLQQAGAQTSNPASAGVENSNGTAQHCGHTCHSCAINLLCWCFHPIGSSQPTGGAADNRGHSLDQ
jgi:hypothetical protein